MEAVAATAGRSGPGGSRTLLHLLANVLLGTALGLLAYYSVTNLVNSADQSVLRTEFGVVGSSLFGSDSAAPHSIDLSGWEAQDAAYWSTLPAGGPFARIVAEKMGLDAVVVKGTAAGDLRRGPGWIVTTDVPGATGNVGISGHRTTYGHPFGRLDALAPGDTIDIYSPYRRYRYEVVRTFAVTPDHVEVVAHTEEPMLTLTACHPPYSARQRLIVQAKLVDVRPLETVATPGE